eukprot:3384917-Amphidinium_carterae.3
MAAWMRCSTRECRPRGLRNPSLSLLATTAAPLQSVTTTPCPCKRSQATMMAWSSALDPTSALPVVGLSRMLTTAVREEQGICGGARRGLFHRRQFLRELDTQSKGLDTGGDLLSEGAHLSFFALGSKERAFKNHMMWRAKAILAKSAGRVFIEDSSPAVVHPKTAAGRIYDRS